MLVNIPEELFIKLEAIAKGNEEDIVIMINRVMKEFIEDNILDL